MRHTSTSRARAVLSFAAIPLRLLALLLRILAWAIDPEGGAPWNSAAIVKALPRKPPTGPRPRDPGSH
jgi:hypothetical protein